MSQNPDPADGPVLELIDGLVPPAMHAAAVATCRDGAWRFGHGSNTGEATPFWKMDLDGVAAFDAIWHQVRPRCEQLAGVRLRVIRQYANGHTYGLGGSPHMDDVRPGTFTLLYYPMAEWRDEWDGETVFFGERHEIDFAVRIRPNRAVFFDSRLLHCGRAPSRACHALRVTVAYKLEAIPGEIPPPPPPDADAQSLPGVRIEEVARDGSRLQLRVHIEARQIDTAVDQALQTLARSVSLPGQPQNAAAAIAQRYGAQARHDVLRHKAVEVIERALHPRGIVAASCELIPQTASGGAEFSIAATELASLPEFDVTAQPFDHPTADADTIAQSGLAPDDVTAGLREVLHTQVLDRLNTSFPIPILPSLTARELDAMLADPDIAQMLKDSDTPDTVREELRGLAERRLRLGFLVLEIARRRNVAASTGAELEAEVIAHILAHAQLTQRSVTAAELHDLLQ